MGPKARFVVYGFTSYLWFLQLGVNLLLGNENPVGALGSSASAAALPVLFRILLFEPTGAALRKLTNDQFLRNKWGLVRGWSLTVLIFGLAWWTVVMFTSLDAHHSYAAATVFRKIMFTSWTSYFVYLVLSVGLYLIAVGLTELKEWIFQQ